MAALTMAVITLTLAGRTVVAGEDGTGSIPGGRDRAVLAYNPRNLLRLHVVANSDRVEDQRTKLRVRDELLEVTRPLFQLVRSAEEAEWVVRVYSAELAALLQRTVWEAGARYPVHLEIGDTVFPERTYGNLTLPAGVYRAVRVVLGEGKGANWWCVLFPPLCFDFAPLPASSSVAEGAQVARAAAHSPQSSARISREETKGDGKPVGKPGIRIGWKWLPDDWWERVRRLFGGGR